MNFFQSFILALRSLMSSKLRSFLTMLGIIIGVASVIVLVSLVDGMAKNMTSQFESMGTNLITVSIMGRNSSRAISAEEIAAVVEKNSDSIKSFTPNVSLSSATIKYQDVNITSTCTGVNENYMSIKNLELSDGRFLYYADVRNRSKVCVIGSYIAKKFFDGVSPLNKEIKIKGESFLVVGVLEEKADSEESSTDDIIYAPYSVIARINKNATIGSYFFSALNKDTSTQAVTAIKKALQETFSDTDAYRVFNQDEMLKKMKQMTNTLSMVLVGVAGISLLVGGIGIMNIMLVSVTERTREIGIRKALGAQKKDIMSQFIVEAATTSSMGGIAGIVLGIVASLVIGNAMSLTISPSFNAIIIAFSVSAVIGIMFGYFPANRASILNPIEALR